MSSIKTETGIVIIGRNEGKRLQRCLQSVHGHGDIIVYVDSGSSDDSVSYANSLSVDVVQLDMSTPFSASRARNEGFRHIINKYPQLRFVQFIDGDCELFEGWLAAACEHLLNNQFCAIIAGRLKERFPEKSIYNFLCDLEWNTPLGDVKSCGGIFMIRTVAFQSAGGFNPVVIAGEEPDLCYRLRKNGWKIYRLNNLMALHDAAMTKFTQWWKRMIRGGYGALDVVTRLKQKDYLDDEIPFSDMIRSAQIWTWGWLVLLLILALSGILCAGVLGGLLGMMAGSGLWMFQSIRIACQSRALGTSWPHAMLYGVFTMIGKWPQMIGQKRYRHNMKKNITSEVIEYK